MADPCPNPKTINQVSNRELDRQLDQETISDLWHYAKDHYFGMGIPHHEIVADIAREFDMPERMISYALDKPKSIRKASEEAKQRMRESARFLAQNKKFLEQFDKTGVEKAWNLLEEGTKGSLLAQHGPVISQTHAIDVLFTDPVKFLQTFFRGVASFNEANVDKFLAKMTATPEDAQLHKMFYDAGAPIGKEPAEGFVEHGLLSMAAKKLDLPFLQGRSWAAKAMDGAMKPLRFELMKNEWNKYSSDMQTPELSKFITEQMSHGTGAMRRGEPILRTTSAFRRLLLAGQLTISKWMKVVADPAKTANTYWRLAESGVNQKLSPPSPEAIAIANSRTRMATRFLGTVLASLKVNQLLLQAAHSKQQVNFDDPTKADWMAFKFMGHYWRPRGTLEVIALINRMISVANPYGKQPYGKSPEEYLGRYSEYKLHPVIGLARELSVGRDVFGRPVPWSKEPGTAKFPRLEWPEFVGQRGPIFLGHAIQAAYDEARELGIDTKHFGSVMNAMVSHPEILKEVALQGGAEFLGLNVQKDLMVQPKSRQATPQRLVRPSIPRPSR